MKAFFLLLVASISLSVPIRAVAEGGPRDEATAAIRENEKKFFELGQEQGTRDAFLQFLASDSIIFNPGPVNGKAEWSKRPEKGISLKWKPEFVWVSRSADLGYSTGPAEWRKNKEDEKPFGYGQFVSIWKKQKDGSWKVAVDFGNEVPGAPKNEEEEAASESYPADDGAKTDQAAAPKKLREAESQFATAAKADSTIALTEASIPTVRVHREGVYPAIGKYAAQLMLSVRRGKLALERLGGGISEAGDLAYSYGKYKLEKPENLERGHYVQIWRLEPDGSWKIALDYQSPLPVEEKKPAK
jgi:ketosteroid isomerase-like protein